MHRTLGEQGMWYNLGGMRGSENNSLSNVWAETSFIQHSYGVLLRARHYSRM